MSTTIEKTIQVGYNGVERINFRRHEMVKHIILWKLKETLTEEEKIQAKKDIKENFFIIIIHLSDKIAMSKNPY